MSVLVGSVPGLVIAATIWLFAVGLRMLWTDPESQLDQNEIAVLRKASHDRKVGPLESLAAHLVPTLKAALPPKALTWLGQQVKFAGRSAGLTVDGVLTRAGMWIIILSPVVLIFMFRGQLLIVALCVLIVVIMPLAGVMRMARLRRDQIDRDLPDFLDVLAVTVTAGLGFRAALFTVAERFGGAVAEEIQHVLHQVDNGATMRAGFNEMRRRTDSDSVDEFVTAYLQSEELGAPLADALNHIAADMRRASAQRMRQKAGRVSPRVTLAVTIILVPGALILLAGGMYVAYGAELFGSLSGGFGGG